MDAESVAEIRRHFDVVAEGLTAKIEQVAEGVLGVDEKLGSVHDAIDAELGEIQSMVKLCVYAADSTGSDTVRSPRPSTAS